MKKLLLTVCYSFLVLILPLVAIFVAYVSYHVVNDLLYGIPFHQTTAVIDAEGEYPLTKDREKRDIYYYGVRNLKVNYMIKIYGSTCDNIIGNFYITSRTARNMWEAYKVVSSRPDGTFIPITPFDNQIEIRADKEFKEKWLNEIPTAGKFLCSPYVKNLKKYLDNSKAAITSDNAISFKDGPTLTYLDNLKENKVKGRTKDNNSRINVKKKF